MVYQRMLCLPCLACPTTDEIKMENNGPEMPVLADANSCIQIGMLGQVFRLSY